MAIDKKANYKIVSLDTLNDPVNWEEINTSFIKTAKVNKDKTDLGGFDLTSAIKDHPEHLFVKIFAIKANEVNDNADYFSTKELKKAYETFVGVPMFCNHQNDDIEKARGKVVHSWYDDDKDGIYIIGMVDKTAYPKLARGIEENYITGSSMGCSVSYSLCSICHNKAHVADEYCTHIKEKKNRKVSGNYKCQYHDSPSKPNDACPVCHKKKGETNELIQKEAHVYEHNFDIKFIEDSFVVNPACHDCNVEKILNASELSKKVAGMRNVVTKLGKAIECSNGMCDLEKVAGKKEIEFLNDAMNKMEIVAKSMMSQKEKISMEYVTDIVEAMSSIQGTIDELVEMGILQIPSPTNIDWNIGLPTSSSGMNVNTTGAAGEQMQASQPQAAPQPVQQPTGNPNVQTEGMGNLGYVTTPKNSNTNLEKIKEVLAKSQKIMDRIQKVSEYVYTLQSQDKENKELNIMANSNDKVEKVAGNPTDVTTERQLDSAKFTGERWDKAPDKITEKQLDNVDENVKANVTTSTSPQERLGTYEVITEKQLDSITSGYITRWGDAPDVITEKQWTDVSRWIGSKLSNDQSDRITEKQLLDFRTNHRFVVPETITQKQLSDQDGALARWAYTYDPIKTAKAAMEAISDVIAFYGKTPSEIYKAASTLNGSVENKAKASFLVAINSMPHKAEAVQNEKERMSYFSKIASSGVKTPDTIDALIVAMASKVQDISADDIVEAIGVVSANSKAMATVEKSASEKINTTPKVSQPVNKTSQLLNAINQIDRPEDGVYQIYSTVKEIGIAPKADNKAAFLKAAHKFASQQIADSGLKFVITKVDTDKSKGLVVLTAKDVSKLNDNEKKVFAQYSDPGMFGDEDKSLKGTRRPALDPSAGLGMEGDLGGDEGFEMDDLSGDKGGFGEPSNSDLDAIEGNPVGDETLNPLADDFGAEDDLGAETGGEALPGEVIPGGDVGLDGENDLGGELGGESGGEFGGEFGGEEPAGIGAGMGQGPAARMPRDRAFATSRKQIRTAMKKESQMLGGEMGGGVGGGTTLPQPPAAAPGGAPGAQTPPPVESFEQSDLGEGLEGGDDQNLDPKPPGSVCPVCTSADVDIVNGSGKCNNCGSEFRFKVLVEVARWANLLENDSEDKEGEEGAGEEGAEGEGFELPEAGAEAPAAGAAPEGGMPAGGAPAMPAAASVKNDLVTKFASMVELNPESLKKASAGGVKKIGSVSPITGSSNTLDLGKGKHVCLDSGREYRVAFSIDKKDPKKAFAQWEWDITPVITECPSCSRAKKAFASALKTVKVSEEQFDKMSFKDKGKVILALKKAGKLGTIKTASTNDSVLAMYKKATFSLGDDKFPMESCMERVARRYGKEALAMSGPCEGKPLYECVCNSLKKANVYSNQMAMKVAGIWSEEEGTTECNEDYIRMGFKTKEASTICNCLKMKYAGIEDMLAEGIGQAIGNSGMEETQGVQPQAEEETDPFDDPDGGGNGGAPAPEMSGDDNGGEMGSSPVEEGIVENGPAGETVSIELPMEVAKQLDEALDTQVHPGGEEGEAGEAGEIEIPFGETPEGVEIELEVKPENSEMGNEAVENKVDDVVENTVENDVNEEGGNENPFAEKEENTEGSEGSEKECPCGKTNPAKNLQNNKGDSMPNKESNMEKAGDENPVEAESNMYMRKGYIGNTGEVNLDLSGVIAALSKKAGSVKTKPAQDVAKDSVGNIGDGSQALGDEKPFKAESPSVPRGNAAMGQEKPPKASIADVFTGPAQMGNEELDSELTDTATGGEKGAGGEEKAAFVMSTPKSRMDELVMRIAEKMQRKFPQDDPDIGKTTGTGFIGHEEESIGAVPKAKPAKDQKVPTGDGFIGKEKESIGEKPTEKNAPEIPSKDARIGGEKDNPAIKSEKTNQMTGNDSQKGNVTASKKESNDRVNEAFRIAGRMLETGMIKAAELSSKVSELSEYRIAQLKDIEKSMFSSKKGLNAASDGLEQAVIISEASTHANNQKNAQSELSNKLSTLFSLSKQVAEADSDELVQLRKQYGR